MKTYYNCYVGIPLPQEYLDEFGWLINEVKSYIPGVRSVNPNSPHITVYYLGTQQEEFFNDIEWRIQSENHILQNTYIETCGLNFFNISYPKVIFLDTIYNTDLQKYYFNIGKKLDKYNKIDDRPYVPHITIARIKDDSVRNNFKNNFREFQTSTNVVNWKFKIDEIVLFGRESKERYTEQSKLCSFKNE